MNEAGGRTDVGEGTDDRVPDLPLGRLLAQIERQLARQMAGMLSVDGLTVDQWRVLDLLSDGEGHTMSEIAAAIVVPGPTLTKIIDGLVDAATVYRLVDARDRRRVLAFLSDSGRAVHERVAPRIAAAEAAALVALGPAAPVLLDLLDRLAQGSRARP